MCSINNYPDDLEHLRFQLRLFHAGTRSWRDVSHAEIFCTLLSLSLILCACSAVPSSPAPLPPTATDAPTIVPTTAVPDPGSCGYQWAYQDLPELSSSFQQSIHTLQPEAQASAFAFGENCILADGSVAGFTAMETDFNVTLQVTDLVDESELGEWIVNVMQIITAIPPEQIIGSRPGRVSVIFQSGDQKTGVNFISTNFRCYHRT